MIVCTRLCPKETEYLMASMVHVLSSDLQIVMMDVDKQSNGSDCGVLAIAYAFDICSGMDPCSVRFDHSNIWPLVLRIARCLVSLYWVTERVSRESQRRWSSTVHVVCQREMVISLLSVTPAMSGTIATVWTFPVRCLMRTQRSTGSAIGGYSHTPRPLPLASLYSLRAYSNGESSCWVCVLHTQVSLR